MDENDENLAYEFDDWDKTRTERAIDDVLGSSSQYVDEYLDGKESILGYFVGRVMMNTQGVNDPQHLKREITAKLEEMRKERK